MTQTDKVDFTDVRWGSVEWTNLCTLYMRAYESHSPAPILGDDAAAEAVARIEYDWARMRRAMRPGSNQYMVTGRRLPCLVARLPYGGAGQGARSFAPAGASAPHGLSSRPVS